MENIILATILYIAIVAIAYQPKPATETTPVNYFPEVEEETETTEVIQYPAAIPAFTAPKSPAMAIESDLMALSIRQLKKLASGRIKRYSSLTKKQLSQRLSGLIQVAELS